MTPQPPPDDPGNPTVNFHGESRRNDTHQSTTDPDARLARKGQGKEAKLSYAGHVLLDNRHGLVANVCVTAATGTAEREAALLLLAQAAGAADEWGADLIVVGSHGRTGVKRWLLGSVAGAIVSHAPCCVVVRRREHCRVVFAGVCFAPEAE